MFAYLPKLCTYSEMIISVVVCSGKLSETPPLKKTIIKKLVTKNIGTVYFRVVVWIKSKEFATKTSNKNSRPCIYLP